ncbi:MAG: hypothetical protein U9O06_13555 [Euryarchaeota archaeon]|nr:hypothetical protein [Euryarchaeota archaeon]
MRDTDTSPHDITTDHETIREWVEQRDGTPAQETGQGDDARSLYVVQEDETMEGLEPISWEAFFETFEAEELAFVYQDRDVGETDEWLYDLIDREEVAERASLETTDVEQSLLDGEVVRSELTETKVIETTVVETDRIESEIVDSEIVESNLVDRETIGREIIGVSFEDAPDDLTPTLRSERAEPTTVGGDTGQASPGAESPAAEGDSDQDSTTPADSPFDEPADKTIPDPPVQRRSTDREEVNRTATSQQSMRRDATGQEPGDRRASDSQSDDASTSHQTSDEATTDRQPIDETTAEPAADRQDETASTAGLDVGDGVVLDVHDTVRTTTEVFDRKTVESRVVDQEITEADTVESDAIDIQGVEETIIESDLIDGEVVTDETGETDAPTAGMPSGAIESERTEGDAIHSQFVERRLVETESTEHHQLTCDISDHMLADTVDSRSTVIERAIVDREADEEVMLQEPEAGVRTSDEQIAAAEESATPTAGADAEMAAEPGDTGEAGATSEGGASDDSATEMQALTDDEIGKQVVSGNKDVGIVSDVDTETQTLYVDPEPSLTDRIKATLDWGDTDDDSYPVGEDQIEAVDDDEIRISKL